MAEDKKISGYDFKSTEEKVLAYWEKNKIYEKSKEKNKDGKKYRYLDGPPYTSGAIHIGHAWGKSLRDASLRYRRMLGYNCWDTPGFDTHGLPIEVAVEKKLGIQDKHEITEKFGMKKFIEECQKFAIEQMHPMVKDFKRIGIWLNWDDPYITFKNEYIEGAWWALKKAQEKGYLYLGEKAMTWCPRCATALAKHELEYETVNEDSIFVKLKVKGKDNEYLIIWTTTPWTMPFNLAVMANPELDYVKAKVDNGETWILAKGMAPSVIQAVADRKFETIEEFKGEKLEGLEYEPIFSDELPIYAEIKKKNKNAFTVLMSKEYVSLGSGSGLVHCAPGCGPEDYEVGRKNNIPPFNELDEHGKMQPSMGMFAGLTAKKDDKKFMEILDKKGILIATTKVEHEYAHCWRCKTGVVYKTTDQWFLAVEKLKDKMIELNKKVTWVPDWGGNRWFDSWLKDLQDWCISRQRFWGIPLPIWTCEKCKEVKLVESGAEIEKLTGKKLNDLHRPWIDEVEFKCKCGGTMKRVPDILDVWLDSGAATWATWENKKDWETVSSDFILEGKDQIRGWFNSLNSLSMVSREIGAFKAVYMHGFVNDSQGRKMSKSLKNIISPYEVIDEYGADTMRYYTIGAAKPGLDMSYNFEDMRLKFRNLAVLWNVHKFLIDYSDTIENADTKIISKNLGVEEKYILSRLNSMIKEVTQLYEDYRLNEIPEKMELLFLDLSRTYIQMIREKSVSGTDEEKQTIFAVIYNVLLDTLKVFSTIAPFICEEIYLNLREKFSIKPASITLQKWPEANSKLIDEELEKNMDITREITQAIYNARESSQLGIRWPVKDVIIVSKDENVPKAVKALKETIKTLTNVKDIIIKEEMGLKKSVKADYKKMGPVFGEKTPNLIAQMAINSPETILGAIERTGKFVLKADGKEFEIVKEHLMIENIVPEHLAESKFRSGFIYLNKDRTKELEAEGFSRELTRRVQALRKNAGMIKTDDIDLFIQSDKEIVDMLKNWASKIKEKVGAIKIDIDSATSDNYEHQSKEKIKGKEFIVMINKV